MPSLTNALSWKHRRSVHSYIFNVLEFHDEVMLEAVGVLLLLSHNEDKLVLYGSPSAFRLRILSTTRPIAFDYKTIDASI